MKKKIVVEVEVEFRKKEPNMKEAIKDINWCLNNFEDEEYVEVIGAKVTKQVLKSK